MTNPSDGRRLVIENLPKRYGRRSVVDDLSFVVEPGRVTGFLGPNGSGKSTTMKVLLDPSSAEPGEAALRGVRQRGDLSRTRAGPWVRTHPTTSRRSSRRRPACRTSR